MSPSVTPLGRLSKTAWSTETRPQDAFDVDISEFGDVVEFLGTLAYGPDAAVRATHIENAIAATTNVSVVPMRVAHRTSVTAILGRAAAVFLAIVLTVTGLAAEAMLPTPIQNAVSKVANVFGLDIPSVNRNDQGASLCSHDDEGQAVLSPDRCDDDPANSDDARGTYPIEPDDEVDPSSDPDEDDKDDPGTLDDGSGDEGKSSEPDDDTSGRSNEDDSEDEEDEEEDEEDD